MSRHQFIPHAKIKAVCASCGKNKFHSSHILTKSTPPNLSITKGMHVEGDAIIASFVRYSGIALPHTRQFHCNLDDMHTAEMALKDDEVQAYQGFLIDIVVEISKLFPEGPGARKYPADGFLFHATALQRWEAYLKAIGKWDWD